MEINTKKAIIKFLRFHVGSCFKDVKNENLHLEKHNFTAVGEAPLTAPWMKAPLTPPGRSPSCMHCNP
mgnify:CR=1 FL=1